MKQNRITLNVIPVNTALINNQYSAGPSAIYAETIGRATKSGDIIDRSFNAGISAKQLGEILSLQPRSKEVQAVFDLQKAGQEKAQKEYDDFYNKCVADAGIYKDTALGDKGAERLLIQINNELGNRNDK